MVGMNSDVTMASARAAPEKTSCFVAVFAVRFVLGRSRIAAAMSAAISTATVIIPGGVSWKMSSSQLLVVGNAKKSNIKKSSFVLARRDSIGAFRAGVPNKTLQETEPPELRLNTPMAADKSAASWKTVPPGTYVLQQNRYFLCVLPFAGIVRIR